MKKFSIFELHRYINISYEYFNISYLDVVVNKVSPSAIVFLP